MNRDPLTLGFAEEFVKKVFDTDADILKLNYADGGEISLAQQLVDFFHNTYLVYPKDVTLRKGRRIYCYSKLILLKLKLQQSKMDALVTPENFFATNIRFIDNTSTGANINRADSTNLITKNEITFNASETVNLTQAHLTNRSATSQINEDEVSLEQLWRKEDLKDKAPLITEQKKLFDIKLPENLEEAKLKDVIEEKKAIEFKSTLLEPREEEVPTAVSYTNIGVNKNLSLTGVEGQNVAKGFTSLADKQVNNATTIQSNFGKIKTDVTTKFFTYNEALFKTFNMQVQDFVEAFFSSFSALFRPVWDGY